MPFPPPVPVDCHRIDLDLPRPAGSDAWLSTTEQARAARFRFTHLQERYRATRVALRALLGQRLGIAPQAVSFVRGQHGKPRLDPAHGSPLHFNLSHSEGVAWIAIGACPLGIDLELNTRPVRLLDSLPERVATPAELATLRALPPALLQAAFLLMWTRKEAALKAWGLGISSMGSLASLDTCLPDPDNLPALLGTPLPTMLSPARIEPPGQGDAAGQPPLHVHSHCLESEILSVTSPEDILPTLHRPHPPFLAPPPAAVRHDRR